MIHMRPLVVLGVFQLSSSVQRPEGEAKRIKIAKLPKVEDSPKPKTPSPPCGRVYLENDAELTRQFLRTFL